MTKYITVNGHGAAWDMVHELAAAAFESLGIISSNGYSAGFSLDDDATKNAGYKVYRAIAYGYDLSDADAEKLYYNYVCDLGTALELNTCGADWSGITFYIRFIDEKQQEPQQEPEASATTAEGSAGETDDYIIRVFDG